VICRPRAGPADRGAAFIGGGAAFIGGGAAFIGDGAAFIGGGAGEDAVPNGEAPPAPMVSFVGSTGTTIGGAKSSLGGTRMPTSENPW
jgi:hypothetical protein